MICPGCGIEFEPGLYGIGVGPKQIYCNPRCQMRTNNRRLYERRKRDKLADMDRRIRQIIRDAVRMFRAEEKAGKHPLMPIPGKRKPSDYERWPELEGVGNDGTELRIPDVSKREHDLSESEGLSPG